MIPSEIIVGRYRLTVGRLIPGRRERVKPAQKRRIFEEQTRAMLVLRAQ